jgi:hypothetical protein
MNTQNDKENKKHRLFTLKEYECGYCHCPFRQYVRRIELNHEYGHEPKHVSSQVRCPYCKQFARTWLEGKELGDFEKRNYALLDIGVVIKHGEH